MFYVIYETRNKINDKIYIGKHQTTNLEDGYLGSGRLISSAIKKYGIENFERKILFVFETEDEMNSKEKELVTEEFCLREDTYNLCPGGHGGFGYINSNIQIDREKLGKKSGRIHKDRLLSDLEYLERNRIISKNNFKNAILIRKEKLPKGTFFGKTHSVETRKLISEKSKEKTGIKNSQFGTCWVTNGIENKKIKKNDLYLWIEQGYNKGRKL